jgi:hypothetical protein
VTINSSEAKFAVRCNEYDEGAVARELTKGANAGKKIYEKKYDEVEGMVKSINYTTKNIGDKSVNQIEVTLNDEGKDFLVQIPWSMRIRDHFIKRIVNVDFKKPISIKLFKDKEKDTCVLNIKQNDVTVPMSFTKDNPGDLPQPVKKTVKGVDTFDYTMVEEFLYQELMKISEIVQEVNK